MDCTAAVARCADTFKMEGCPKFSSSSAEDAVVSVSLSDELDSSLSLLLVDDEESPEDEEQAPDVFSSSSEDEPSLSDESEAAARASNSTKAKTTCSLDHDFGHALLQRCKIVWIRSASRWSQAKYGSIHSLFPK